MTAQQKTALVTQLFIDFEIELRFAEYETWRSEGKVEIEDQLDHVNDKLESRGVLTRPERKDLIIERDDLIDRLLTDDPRWVDVKDFNAWLVQAGVVDLEDHQAVQNESRKNFKRLVSTSMSEAETIKNMGITPFVLDSERSAKYFILKTLEQYQLDQTKHQLPMTETRLKGMSTKRKKISRMMEGYGGEDDSLINTNKAGDQAIKVILAVTEELKPMMISICSQKDKLDILLVQSQQDNDDFMEFTKWKADQQKSLGWNEEQHG